MSKLYKTYNEKQLEENYNKFIDFIKKSFTGDRQTKLLKLYDDFANRVALAPASTRENFHSCYAGGYMDHVMNVCKAGQACKNLWKYMGGTIDFTDEELAFCCLNHDLGKVGDETGEYYLNETEEWKSKKGNIFKVNDEIQYMDVTDRAIYLLQKYQITMTWKEMLGIKLADGLYNDGNDKYLKRIVYTNGPSMRTNLPHVVHLADMIACHVENDQWVEATK